MNKEESLNLYNKGREAWNAWAKEMLAQRDKLMEAGQWVLDHLSGNNLATQDWFTRAMADFSGHAFETDTDFSGFLFPGDAKFTTTKFVKEASFKGAIFSGKAMFEEATFSSKADFVRATFSGKAWFVRATFSGGAEFWRAMFSSKAEFGKVTFSDWAWFVRVTFSGKAEFWGAMFSGTAGFEGAIFRSEAGFNQATFESFADFSGTHFKEEANFVAIRGQSAFTLQEARFSVVPDFRQAHFEEAPQLDDARFHDSKPRLLWGQDRASVKKDVASRWRALKRLATQGHDHEREIDFLAEEVKSRRGVQDWLLPNPLSLRKGEPICWPGGGRYWAGLFYQWSSDFGRSVLRPFLGWMAITFGFTLYYLSHHPDISDGSMTLYHAVLDTETALASAPLTCRKEDLGEPLTAAFYLSIHNGLVIPGLGRSETLARSYACLYDTGKENVPYPVVFAGLGQTVISTVLIFLFLLALRNYFRIK